MPNISTRDSDRIREHCIDRSTFQTHGSLRGAPILGTPLPGRLPEEYHASFKAAEYAVFSYRTPIAWYGPDGWTFPNEKYGTTTSRHQSRLYFIHNWIKD